MSDVLQESRQKIDTLDKKIVALLNERMVLTDEVGNIKRKYGLATDQKSRETELVGDLQKKAVNPILKDAIPDIYRAIFKASKLSQKNGGRQKLPYKKIGIIGFGFMGGSIAKAIKILGGSEIYALRQDKTKIDSIDIADVTFSDLDKFIESSELIFIATPIGNVVETARIIANTKKRGKKLIVADIASTKRQISYQFEKLSNEYAEFLPTHPMAGSEKSGYNHSRAGIFEDRSWIITPHKKNSQSTIGDFAEFATSLGAKSTILTPEIHDRRIASVSHLVFVVASYLSNFIVDKRPETAKLASSGFASATRVAGGNPQMHSEIYIENGDNIRTELAALLSYIASHPLTAENAFEFFSAAKYNHDSLI